MQPLIAGKYIDKYLIYSRFSTICTVITEQRFLQMVHLSENPDSLTPKWLKQIFNKFGYSEIIPYKFNDAIFVRRPSSTNFGRASFEITKSCNYKCHHCYLGKKTTRSLSTSEKQKILQIIDKSGCLWLQITGGEPLLSEDFIAVYTYAYSLGLLITLSTNGSLLINSNIKDTISKYPPFRITISMYGATQDSYENLTQVKGSFSQFTNSLEWVKKMGIKVRINIIITRFNEHELDAMINMVNKYNFECCIYSKLTPTIDGDPTPLKFMGTYYREVKNEDIFSEEEVKKSPCQAGITFYHVDSSGRASICQAAREPCIDLLQEGINGLRKLDKISNQLLESPDACEVCDFKKTCRICPPMLNLYRKIRIVPKYICQKRFSEMVKNDF